MIVESAWDGLTRPGSDETRNRVGLLIALTLGAAGLGWMALTGARTCWRAPAPDRLPE